MSEKCESALVRPDLLFRKVNLLTPISAHCTYVIAEFSAVALL
jgi:hypothetical protein